MAARNDLKNVAREQDTAAFAPVRPVQDIAAGKVASEANERETRPDRLGIAIPMSRDGFEYIGRRDEAFEMAVLIMRQRHRDRRIAQDGEYIEGAHCGRHQRGGPNMRKSSITTCSKGAHRATSLPKNITSAAGE